VGSAAEKARKASLKIPRMRRGTRAAQKKTRSRQAAREIALGHESHSNEKNAEPAQVFHRYAGYSESGMQKILFFKGKDEFENRGIKKLYLQRAEMLHSRKFWWKLGGQVWPGFLHFPVNTWDALA
jgi:hypothetical protein